MKFITTNYSQKNGGLLVQLFKRKLSVKCQKREGVIPLRWVEF